MLSAACVTELQVHRHATVDIDNQDVGYILDDFTDIVSLADSPGDFACSSEVEGNLFTSDYVQDGSVSIYSGPSVINSQEDFDDVISQPGYVKVVSAINWCGDFGPNIIGCAPVPGDSFAVVRVSGSTEGILWAHEFGHTVGLSHRTDALAVMRGTINPNNRDITSVECLSFNEKRNSGSESAAASGRVSAQAKVVSHSAAEPLLDGSIGSLPTTAASADDTAGIVAFVRNIYPHGTPMSVVAGFENSSHNSAAIPILLQMLAEPSERAYWGNIVVVLGMLGGADVTPALIRFANEQHLNSPSSEGLGNTTAALMALGYLVNRTGDLAAINFLQTAQNPQAWQADTQSQQQLATAAQIGAAFSGAQLAGPTSRSAVSLKASLALALQDLHQNVASVGIVDYYRDRQK